MQRVHICKHETQTLAPEMKDKNWIKAVCYSCLGFL